VSIGDTLAEARRQAGLTITQVSQRTRIRESIIRGIEQGDFSACGGDFYARGHIRSIAGVVGADPVPLINEYDAEHGSPGGISAAEVFEPSTPIRIRERRSPSLSMIVVVVLLAIIGFSAYHLVSTHNRKNVAAPTAHVTQHTTTQSTPKASPTPSLASPMHNDVVIQLTAEEDCWVLLTDTSSGSQIYMGTIPAGQSMTWTEKQAVSLKLGNPPGVVLTVDGKRRSTNSPQVLSLNFVPQQS
jgi:transcriptional regulator with XRE-family HTH domain